MRILAGPPALTTFEAARLADRLRSLDAGITDVVAQYLYVLQLREGADSWGDEGKLAELLESQGLASGVPHSSRTLRAMNGPPDGVAGPSDVWIGPRVGTQSPWSSKATDILHNTGFVNIARIERARVVKIAGARDVKTLAGALHDRMTESVFFGGADELMGLFAAREQAPMKHIDVLGRGAAAIAEADR